MKIIERSLQEIGKSLLVTVPKGWATTLKLKKGSKIKIIVSDQGHLLIAPEFTRQKKEKDVNLPYDKNFKRHFLRSYLNGNEKIIIFSETITDAQRKEVYNFLKRFISAQIIEETNTKIIVKCFRIEELSIEECLKRMFFLSLNMFDEALGQNDKLKLNEMEDSITKFYYLLVMQIRRFLEEGKYTQENQITLIRTLDFRMTAEKIEKVSDILKKIGTIKNDDLRKLLKDAREHYFTSVNCFLNNNYDKALEQWHDWKAKREKYKKIKEKATQTKDTTLLEQSISISTILNLSKEISMLIR